MRGAPGVWLRAVSRLGLACRGVVYLLVGYLALRLALAARGRGGAPASSAGAVQAAVSPAWGRVPLVLLVAGLGAYALSQLLEAVFRPAHATSTLGRHPMLLSCQAAWASFAVAAGKAVFSS